MSLESTKEKLIHEMMEAVQPKVELVKTFSGYIKTRLAEKSQALPLINQWLANIHCFKNGCMRNPVGLCMSCGSKEDNGC